MNVDGKRVAIVAGGSTGIGLAVTRSLLAEGLNVCCLSHDAASLQAVSTATAEADRQRLLTLQCDLADAAQISRAVETTVERFGGIDALAYTAGVQAYGSVVETPEDCWDHVMDVNLKGVYRISRACIPHMARRGGGAIVIISSVQGLACQAGVAAYAASKGGVNALVRAMAIDHAADGIRVNALCPGSVDTPMLRASAERFRGDKTVEDTLAEWGKSHALGRVARPDEVANVACFLLGDKASFVTGSTVTVDGGLTAALAVRLPEDET
ncbi:MAG: SDR family oxidoreductase [Gammaproteobacteria bacterium]|nr:SDR family oxidoreductase [Gammaproteobacteria bacterium]